MLYFSAMKNELRERLLAKRATFAVGSQEYLTLTETLLELDEVKLHKEEDATCESCQ